MKNLRKIFIFTLIFTPYALVGATGSGLGNPIGYASIQALLTAILDIVVKIGVPVLVLALVWVGFMFVKAQGVPAELETAKKAFFYTCIGAGVVLGAKVIQEALCATIQGLGSTLPCS